MYTVLGYLGLIAFNRAMDDPGRAARVSGLERPDQALSSPRPSADMRPGFTLMRKVASSSAASTVPPPAAAIVPAPVTAAAAAGPAAGQA